MKILHICAYTWSIGGPARVIYDHTKVALKEGHTVHIASPYSGNDEIYPLPDGAEIFLCRRTTPISKIFNEFSWDLHKFLQRHINDYDVIHCHGVFHYGSVAPFFYSSKVPILITIHGLLDRWAVRHSYWKKKLFSEILQKRLLKRAALIHVFNEDEKQDVANYLGYLPKNIVTIPNGMDLQEYAFLPPKGRFRTKMGIADDTKIILFMGRLNIKKGLDILLPAFQKYIKNDDNTILILAGPDDGYKAQAEQFVTEHSLFDKIKMVGMLTGDDKKEALIDATIFTLPSYSEGFSIAVLEAMAVGTATLVSTRIGFDGNVAKYNAAVEVENLDTEGVKMGLGKILLTTDDTRSLIAQNAKKMLSELFDIEIVAGKLLQEIKKAASAR